ncbi:RnfABCDGE type electron transport complex subunit B [Methylomonas sp. AM2-LC]|uniref:RnfABCDGE type electron transport complex subunit B n=1 Tax=Methylomonas sp. AM2-LC TaxID=3153301 RepID=UPI003267D7FF
MNKPLAEQIDALLPQTQCGKCGYAGCQPYAEAMSQNQADITLCPPGGGLLVEKLADLLGKDVEIPTHLYEPQPRRVAVISETECIGCTKCIPPCPVDAIVGAAKFMHTVIAEQCTGCELCIAPCPVNCISMEISQLPLRNAEDVQLSKVRFHTRNERIVKLEAEKTLRLQRQKQQLELLKKTKTIV